MRPDSVAARLQAKFEALEASPGEAEPNALRRRSRPAAGPAEAGGIAGGSDGLNGQLEVLREQLEGAFDELELRLATASARAAAADARAQGAEVRAAAADARMVSVLAAIEEMCQRLEASTRSSLAGQGDAAEVSPVQDAVGWLRKRLHTE